MILTLIGYRATGKTTLAQILAERLGWRWIDADVEIERRAGKTIAQIFAEEGEPGFRDREAAVIDDLCRSDRLVLAAGGGAPLREANRTTLRAAGKVVWLTARPETIHHRMTADPSTASRRPNLTAHDPLDEIIRLLAAREPLYRQTADLTIDTENRPPDDLADEILQKLSPILQKIHSS
jgi:shikimate kinase